MFTPNRKFKKAYHKIFKEISPEAANLFLLMNELADDKGQICASEGELYAMMCARFNDPCEDQFRGE